MSKQWDSFKRWTIVLTVVGILVGAAATIFPQEFRRWLGLESGTEPSIAGRVVDDATGMPISGAVITIVGRTESVRSESNGNFILKIKVDSNNPGELRLEVAKSKYQIWDQNVVPPQSAMIVSLKRE
jgi:hypothetical protein